MDASPANVPAHRGSGPRWVRRVFAVGASVWLTFVAGRGAFDAFASLPDGSHERAWTTTFAEREELMLAPVRPVLDAIAAHTDPAALILAPVRVESTAIADIAVNGMVGWARFLALPRMVVVVEVERRHWRERAEQVAASDELWVLDMIGATAGDDADLEPVADGPGWRLLRVVRDGAVRAGTARTGEDD